MAGEKQLTDEAPFKQKWFHFPRELYKRFCERAAERGLSHQKYFLEVMEAALAAKPQSKKRG